ncbi:RNA-guided endonuclease InsQ/TnpB family protein [Streptomyces rubiginosohelvolus]|uniref:RNA-guided endonuclease InsQ/TnpB family protein n=1 Tax=Streptomyces rubiginosohelvolus TaxID=67362 RepID=UPI0037943E33
MVPTASGGCAAGEADRYPGPGGPLLRLRARRGADRAAAAPLPAGRRCTEGGRSGRRAPRLLKKYGAKLADLQRSLHRKKRGSRNREKARQEIARLYALIGDVRRDALDQLTTRLVRENQVLVVEDLAVASLVRSPKGKGRRRKAGLNRAILDASWGELFRQLQYKCAWYGRTLVLVDRFFPSTRRCSACGVVGPKRDLVVRGWSCGGCGAEHDRDVNAARNLRDEGMRLYELVASALPSGRAMPSMIRASEVPDVVLTA